MVLVFYNSVCGHDEKKFTRLFWYDDESGATLIRVFTIFVTHAIKIRRALSEVSLRSFLIARAFLFYSAYPWHDDEVSSSNAAVR